MKKILLELTIVILFFLFVVATLLIFIDRNEKIENGELTQISESYIDR